MQIKTYIFLLFCILFIPVTSLAAVSRELTLNDAILLALRYNPNIKNAEIQRIVDKFSLRVAENNYELNYALSGAANYNHSAQGGTVSESNNYSLTPAVNLPNSAHGTNFTLNAANTI